MPAMLKAVDLLCFFSTSAKLFNCENPGCFFEVAWTKLKTPQAGTEDLPIVAHPSTCFLALGFFSFSSTPILPFLSALLSAQKTSYISLFRCEIHLLLTIPVLCILKILLYQTVWASSLVSQACNSLLYYITSRFYVFTYKSTEISVKPIAINVLFPELGCFMYNCKGKYKSIGFFIFLHPWIMSHHDLKLSVDEVYTWTASSSVPFTQSCCP